MDAGLMGQAQRIPELGMRFLIGRKLPDSLHLDYKQDIGLIPCLYRFCQFQPRSVGASGNMAMPFSSKVTPLTSIKAGFVQL